MKTCYIVVDGRSEPFPVTLPSVPRRGDVVTGSTDNKTPYYLVKCIEYISGHETVNLHVQPFPNQISAVNAIDGFRNSR